MPYSSWEIVREEVEMEARLVSLPTESITIDAARQLLMRLRVMSSDITHEGNINSEIRRRFQLLRAKIIVFDWPIIEQLTEAERSERRQISLDEQSGIIAMDPDTVSLAERRAYLDQWRLVVQCHAHQIDEDVAERMHLWLSVALIKLDYLNIDGLTRQEANKICVNGISAESHLRVQLDNGNFEPGEEAGLRSTLLTLSNLPEVQVENFEADQDLDQRFFLMLMFGLGREDEAADEDERQRNIRHRNRAILSLFPSIILENLPPDNRTCHICQEPYGTPGYEDKDACEPLAMPCCPPVTMGSACIVTWFSRKDGPYKCPICKYDWEEEIEAAAAQF